MKKILFLSSTLAGGGRERQLVSLLTALCEVGYDLEIHLIVFYNDVFFTEVFDLPIQIKILHNINPLSFHGTLILARYCRENNFDYIYTADEYVAPAAIFFNFFTPAKVINGSLRHGKVDYLNKRQLFRNLTYRFSKYIIANSYQGFNANKLFRKKNKFVLYNGIDRRFFIDRKNKNDKLLTFLSVSRLHPIKDYKTVLRVLKNIKESLHLSFIYYIIGDGPEKSNIDQLIRKLDLTDEVKLLGSQKEISGFYEQADIFIHSSAAEGCPNVVLEAMASGTPVVASNTGGTPEIVNDKVGRLFEFGNISDLEAKLSELIYNPTLRNNIGNNGKKMVQENFTYDILAKGFIQILSKISDG